MDELSKKQRAFLEAMLVSQTTEEAIQKTKISKSTAYKYINDPEWQSEYREQRNRLTDSLTNQLLKLGTEAVKTLRNNLHDEDATPASKNTTAKTILDYIYTNYERAEIVERIEVLEDLLEKQGGI